MRNTRTGGTRKRVAGETKKGATPKQKGSTPKVSAADIAKAQEQHQHIRQNTFKTSPPKPVTQVAPKTKKVNPHEPNPTTNRPVTKPAVKEPAKKPVTAITKSKTTQISPHDPSLGRNTNPVKTPATKPAVKTPAAQPQRPNMTNSPTTASRVRNFGMGTKKPMP